MNKVSNLPAPPSAEQRPHSYTRHGVTIDDPWAWLRDPNYPDVQDEEVLAYLKAENAYFEAAMAPHAGLVETLFEEMKGRLKEDESSVPAGPPVPLTAGLRYQSRYWVPFLNSDQ